MTLKKKLLLPLLLATSAVPAFADQIPYPHAGTIAPQTLVYATSSGITAYYMGSTAGYDDQIEVFDVQTNWNSGKILDNKSTSVGTKITVGTGANQINAGDQLIFYILSPDGLFANAASYSADGVNHAYLTSYSGGTVNGTAIPAGTFVGMEDLNKSTSDFNYNDDDFVFTGVTTAAVTPEPGALVLFATGAMGLFGLHHMRRRRSAEQA